MKIHIWEKEREFISDFPEGWVFSKGDYFKKEIIEGHKCFIKRFEVKTPANISGWQLLEQLKGKNKANLARLYDLARIEEKRNTVYYVFYEWVEGATLHDLIQNDEEINLTNLTDDLICAIQSLQEDGNYGYWFADFTEKNIFRDKKGKFILIDLDSAQPASKAPDNNMWGDKEYWALVFNFYKEILHRQYLKPADINGVTLNYLQIIFLILKLKLYTSYKAKGYAYSDFSDSLPSLLNNISPQFQSIFNKALEIKNAPFSQHDIAETEKLIKQYIINADIEEPSSKKASQNIYSSQNINKNQNNYSSENSYRNENSFEKQSLHSNQNSNSSNTNNKANAVIKEFKVDDYLDKNDDDYSVESKKPFSLSWKIENGSNIELYKNDEFYTRFEKGENKFVSREVYDGKEKKIKYKLRVTNSFSSTEKLININVVAETIEEEIDDVYLSAVIKDFRIKGEMRKDGKVYIIEAGKPFILSWIVKKADKIEIFKNESSLRTMNGDEKSMELKEMYDGVDREIAYSIEASNSSSVIQRESITVRIVSLVKKPLINSFSVDKYQSKKDDIYFVESNKPFDLTWDIENASMAELLKNNNLYKNVGGINKLTETEIAYDGKGKELIYTLKLTGGNSDTATKSLTVKIKAEERKRVPVQSPSNIWKVLTAVLAVAIVVLAVLYFLNRKGPDNSNTIFFPFDKTEIAANDTITIAGKNISKDSSALQVRFNSVRGKIIQQTSDSLSVVVPPLANNSDVHIIVYDQNIPHPVADHVRYRLPINESASNIFPLSINRIIQGSTITIFGTNLNKSSGDMKILFNGIEGTIVNRNPDSIIVRVPPLPDAKTADIIFYENGIQNVIARNILLANNSSETSISRLAYSSIMPGQIIVIKGRNLPATGMVKVKFNDFDGSVIAQTANSITVQVPDLGSTSSANVLVYINGKLYTAARSIFYNDGGGQTVVNPLMFKSVTEGETVVITGKNLPTVPGVLTVRFKNTVNGKITSQTSTSVNVLVPTLVSSYKEIDIGVYINNRLVQDANLVKYHVKN